VSFLYLVAEIIKKGVLKRKDKQVVAAACLLVEEPVFLRIVFRLYYQETIKIS